MTEGLEGKRKAKMSDGNETTKDERESANEGDKDGLVFLDLEFRKEKGRGSQVLGGRTEM